MKSEMQAVYNTQANVHILYQKYIHAFKLYYAYSYYVVIECNFHKFLTHSHTCIDAKPDKLAQKCVHTAEEGGGIFQVMLKKSKS